MKAIKAVIGVLWLFVTMPIWFFLMYTLLAAIHPDRLVWFLFWIYIPAAFVSAVLQQIAEAFSETRKGGK